MTGPSGTLRDYLARRAKASEAAREKVGLVVQGGGMRGVYTMGALSVLEAEGLRDSFDICVGSSAGAVNLAYFLAAQAREAVDLYVNSLSDRQFIDFRRFWRPVDVDHLVDHCLKYVVPMNVDAIRRFRGVVRVVVTEACTGQPEVITPQDVDVDWFEVMRATCALPVLYNRRVDLRDRRYVDGGVADGLPVARASACGADRTLVLTTRPKGYRSRDGGRLERWVAQTRALTQSRSVRRGLGRADHGLNQSLAFVEGRELAGGHFNGWCLWPSSAARLVGRTQDGRRALLACAEMGQEDMLRLLEAEA